MEIKITIEPLSDAVAEAYARMMPEHADGVARGRLPWRFNANPASSSVFTVAREAGTNAIVGIIAFIATHMILRGNPITGYQAMDNVVDPICRKQGLFTRQVNAFYDMALRTKVPLLYGFPNENAAPGWFRKLGWIRLGSPPFLIKPLRTGYFLKRLLGERARFLDFPLCFPHRSNASRIKTIERFNASADALWKIFAANINCAVIRDHAYLNWRIIDHPQVNYTTKGVYAEDGALEAFISYIVLEKHGGRVGYVMEAICLPGKESVLRALFRDAIADCITKKADVLLAWCYTHAPNYRAYRGAGFWPFPERIRPIHLHFGYRPLGAEINPAFLSEDWYLSYLDTDTV